MDERENKVYAVLGELGIAYVRHEHEPVYTIEQAERLNLPLASEHCKNLFIRNRKGDRHYLTILSKDKNANLKQLAQTIGSSPLSFASEERLDRLLGLTPGAVSPFGLLHDREKAVVVLLDEELTERDSLCFHPNVNTATIELSRLDFLRYLAWCGNPLHLVRLDSGENGQK